MKLAPHARQTLARARSWVGKKYPPGWCLAFQVTHIFGVPGVGDWDGDRAADAEDYWKAAVARGKVVKTTDPKKIPAGVMIMWTGGSGDHGHAAYSLGGGRMISTDLPNRGVVGECDIDLPRRVWNHKLVGYVLVDGNGWTLVPPTPEPPKPDVRVVTASVLNVRATASTSSKIVTQLPKGRQVTVLETKKTSTREWGRIGTGRWVALEHTKKA